jgi:peptide chain release factor 3
VFKVQANMNPKHRDYVAFIRIVSGVFRRDMQATHTRTGRKIRLSNSQRLFARERETVDEAYPGDIVGIVGNHDFLIGDTLSEDPGISYGEMPRFAPESFAYLHNESPAHFKRFRDGLTQLLKEGVAQSYELPDAVGRVPLLGAVGALQFEVLQYRLESEYGAKSRLELAPWTHILWVREKGDSTLPQRGALIRPAANLPSGSAWARDVFGQWVVLLPSAWIAKSFAENTTLDASPLPFS